MTEEFESYKGIHPGKVIARLLGKRNLDQRSFALALPTQLPTFNSILKGERRLKLPLSLKVERALDLEEGSLMTLQIHFDIKLERLRTQGLGPDLPKGLFWDVDISKIDWEKRWHFVIQRVYERGDKSERDVIDRFYGLDKVNEVLDGLPRMPSGRLWIMPQYRNKLLQKLEIYPMHLFDDIKIKDLDIDNDSQLIICRALSASRAETFERDIEKLEIFYHKDIILSILKEIDEQISSDIYELVASRYNVEPI